MISQIEGERIIMREFFKFVFKCIMGFIAMICDSSVNGEELWKFILFGTVGISVFLLVFIGIEWLIHKYFFVRKNFIAEHNLLVSFACACTTMLLCFATIYIFFYQ